MVKSTKKRLASVSEAGVKSTDESALKKKKSENGAVQNGQATKEVKKELQTVTIDKAAKKEARKASREKRKALNIKRGVNPDISVDEIKTKIETIEKRKNLTKTAKRKLAALKKLLRVKEGTDKPKEQVAKKQAEKGKNEKQVEAGKKKQVQTDTEQKKKVAEKAETKTVKNNKKKDAKQGSLLLVKQGESDDEDEDEEDMDVELDDDASDDEDVDEEEDDDEEEVEEEEEEDDDDDEDDEDDEEEENDEDEKVKEAERKAKVAQGAQAKEKSKQSPEQEGKKKRYVLFVGNLPFSVTQEEIKKHFLTKVSQIVDIRIPRKDDNSSKGFAYVELSNHTDYEKAIGLNNSFVGGRRINVQYSGSNKKETVAKNQKLQFLQKTGKLAGGQKRNFQKKNTGFKGQKMKT